MFRILKFLPFFMTANFSLNWLRRLLRMLLRVQNSSFSSNVHGLVHKCSRILHAALIRLGKEKLIWNSLRAETIIDCCKDEEWSKHTDEYRSSSFLSISSSGKFSKSIESTPLLISVPKGILKVWLVVSSIIIATGWTKGLGLIVQQELRSGCRCQFQ